MEIGIFSRTWETQTLEEIFFAMQQNGIKATQFNMASAGMPTMPSNFDLKVLEEIMHLAKHYKIELVALSGTFNMIDPNIEKRKEGWKQFDVLCQIAAHLNIPIVTICTGSKNENDKWAWHPDNNGKNAWRDLIESTKVILDSAKRYNIVLGVEPEVSNIIHSPKRARKYLDEIHSPHLKIVMDGANLFLPEQIKNMDEVLESAFELLGEDIVLAHAKDIAKGKDISFVAAGEGNLNYTKYIELLKRYQYRGPLILHGLDVTQINQSMGYLKERLSDGTI